MSITSAGPGVMDIFFYPSLNGLFVLWRLHVEPTCLYLKLQKNCSTFPAPLPQLFKKPTKLARREPPVSLRSRTRVRSRREILAFNHQRTKILIQGHLLALGVPLRLKACFYLRNRL